MESDDFDGGKEKTIEGKEADKYEGRGWKGNNGSCVHNTMFSFRYFKAKAADKGTKKKEDKDSEASDDDIGKSRIISIMSYITKL